MSPPPPVPGVAPVGALQVEEMQETQIPSVVPQLCWVRKVQPSSSEAALPFGHCTSSSTKFRSLVRTCPSTVLSTTRACAIASSVQPAREGGCKLFTHIALGEGAGGEDLVRVEAHHAADHLGGEIVLVKVVVADRAPRGAA